ncbi:MAG: hypothetical protein V1745_04510 [Patescibacteria group bacterium]
MIAVILLSILGYLVIGDIVATVSWWVWAQAWDRTTTSLLAYVLFPRSRLKNLQPDERDAALWPVPFHVSEFTGLAGHGESERHSVYHGMICFFWPIHLLISIVLLIGIALSAALKPQRKKRRRRKARGRNGPCRVRRQVDVA